MRLSKTFLGRIRGINKVRFSSAGDMNSGKTVLSDENEKFTCISALPELIYFAYGNIGASRNLFC